MDCIADIVCAKLNIQKDMILKRPIRGLPGITAYSLILELLACDTLAICATKLGYSENPVKQAARQLFKPYTDILPNSKTWQYKLLSLCELKKCFTCGIVKPFSRFHRHSGNDSFNLSSECKSCKLMRTYSQKEGIVQRTPPWADMSRLREIYANCPEHYEVDHIVPLRGALVSGLHVEYNLQYLPSKVNRLKSNSFVV